MAWSPAKEKSFSLLWRGILLLVCTATTLMLTEEMRVAQLSGYVAEQTMYHHGEASLQATIVSMAQNFVGANNINLLHPQGMFDHVAANGQRPVWHAVRRREGRCECTLHTHFSSHTHPDFVYAGRWPITWSSWRRWASSGAPLVCITIK